MENAIREKPQFIKRTTDYMVLADLKLLEDLLSAYRFTADRFIEKDGSVTLSLRELDIAENAKTEKEAGQKIGESVLDYARDFYTE